VVSPQSLGPLQHGASIAIIGGGPGGCAAALTLLRLGRESGKRFLVRIFEPKHFGLHYNQCLGVLSPPLLDILRAEFNLELPAGMVQRHIKGYVLHGTSNSIVLEEGEEETLAVRRVELDDFLLKSALEAGAELVRCRVTALEFGGGGVTIYSEGEYSQADLAIGSFGLDAGMVVGLQRQLFYRQPRRIETLVTRYDCDDELMARFGDRIQAFLPRIEGVEFAAITPKARHASVVLAGRRVKLSQLYSFLRMPQVQAFLPPDFEPTEIYKGAFPASPARHYFDDRFVSVGDAAGMIRPFKGKGINSAVITGIMAAKTAFHYGISKRAFRHYQNECAFITRDYPYGRFVRLAVKLISRRLSLGPVIRLAERNETFRWALTKSISGGATYREIVKRCLRSSIPFRLLGGFITWPFRKRSAPGT